MVNGLNGFRLSPLGTNSIGLVVEIEDDLASATGQHGVDEDGDGRKVLQIVALQLLDVPIALDNAVGGGSGV